MNRGFYRKFYRVGTRVAEKNYYMWLEQIADLPTKTKTLKKKRNKVSNTKMIQKRC